MKSSTFFTVCATIVACSLCMSTPAMAQPSRQGENNRGSIDVSGGRGGVRANSTKPNATNDQATARREHDNAFHRPGRTGGDFNHGRGDNRHGNHGDFNRGRGDNRYGNHGDFNRGRGDNRYGRDYGYNRDRNRGNYRQYRYNNRFRPRGGHDPFFDHYRRGWRTPVRPPVRPWRHNLWYYRPSIPHDYRPYASAPVIDGIIGLYFGTLLDVSLDYLYYNGYQIDGYYNDIVYLRNVDVFGYTWPDAMLRYDSYDGLNYAQFSYYSSRFDHYRYNQLYHSLCNTYGHPVSYTRGRYPQVTWVGGDGQGYITLSMNNDSGRFYTALSFGY